MNTITCFIQVICNLIYVTMNVTGISTSSFIHQLWSFGILQITAIINPIAYTARSLLQYLIDQLHLLSSPRGLNNGISANKPWVESQTIICTLIRLDKVWIPMICQAPLSVSIYWALSFSAQSYQYFKLYRLWEREGWAACPLPITWGSYIAISYYVETRYTSLTNCREFLDLNNCAPSSVFITHTHAC